MDELVESYQLPVRFSSLVMFRKRVVILYLGISEMSGECIELNPHRKAVTLNVVVEAFGQKRQIIDRSFAFEGI